MAELVPVEQMENSEPVSESADGDERTEPLGDDALFRQRRKHGKYREVEAPRIEGPLADTHTHVQLTNDPAAMLARAAVWGVRFLCDVVDLSEDDPATAQNLELWMERAKELVAAWAPAVGRDPASCPLPELRLIVGCHPHNAKLYDAAMESRVRSACADPRVCGLGEAGLDFYYSISPHEVQIEAFRRQIRLAHELDLPLCLHIRDAHDIAYQVLLQEGMPQAGAVLHCFNLGPEELKPWLELGCYVGFDGPITFRNSDMTREAARLVPLDRLVTETDAPFMTPEPMRGMMCGPAHVLFVADRLAQVRGCVSPDERRALFERLLENGRRLYGARERISGASSVTQSEEGRGRA